MSSREWRSRVFWSSGGHEDAVVDESVMTSYRKSWETIFEIEGHLVIFQDPGSMKLAQPLVVMFYRGELGNVATR